MLEKFRESINSTWAKIILGLLIASFVFAGVGSYLVNRVGDEVAVVNGEKISRQQFEKRYQIEKNRLGKQFSQYVNTDAAQNEFRLNVINRLILEKLVEQSSRDLGLYVSRETVMEQIKSIQAFKLNGKFNPDTFRGLLASNGLTPEGYELQVRQQKQSEQLSTLMKSEFSLENEIDRQLQLQGQTRSGKYLDIDASLLRASISFEGAEGEKKLQDNYQKNIKRYKVPEKLIVEYIDLDASKLKVDVTDNDIKSYYESHPDDYGTAEQRRASHILINVAKDAKADIVNSAKSKIEDILAQLKQGKDFASLAKKYSDDTVSAENGGDLGFTDPEVLGKEFDNALFSLKKVGALSAVVRTQYGFHIIKLTGIKKGKVKPLSEVKDAIKSVVEKNKREEKFVELNDIMTEKAFEMTDSLEEVAASTEQKVLLSKPFSKQGIPGLFSNQGVLEAAFSDNVLINGFNSEVVSISDDHSLVLRLSKQIPAKTLAFEEVRQRVENNLRSQLSLEKAQQLSQKVLEKINQGNNRDAALSLLPDVLKAKWVPFTNIGRNESKIPVGIVRFIFTMAKPQHNKVVNAQSRLMNGYVVTSLEKVVNGKPKSVTPEQKKQLVENFAKEKSYAEDRAFQKWLQSHAEIKVRPLNNNQ